MKKLELNKQKKKESLLNTAFELFITQGINKTSISDIVQRAGVAKGTFYLYFSDKYDIRNKLISHKSSQLFTKAHNALLNQPAIVLFDDKIVFLVNYIIDALNTNQSLLTFISKNLSWGIFKSALTSPHKNSDVDFYEVYLRMLEEESSLFVEPEIMLFLIVEFVGSTCYSSILYQEPVPIEELKPYLFSTIKQIIHLHSRPRE